MAICSRRRVLFGLLVLGMLFVGFVIVRSYSMPAEPTLRERVRVLTAEKSTFDDAIKALGEPGDRGNTPYLFPRGLTNIQLNSPKTFKWKYWADDSCAVCLMVSRDGLICQIWIIEPEEEKPWFDRIMDRLRFD